MPVAGRSAAEGTQVWCPHDPSGGESGRAVGLRPAAHVLQIVWEWLGVKQPLPTWTTLRMWLLRVGVATLREPIEAADDWVWMADHSNQIGPEKALVVLGVRTRSCRCRAKACGMRMSIC